MQSTTAIVPEEFIISVLTYVWPGFPAFSVCGGTENHLNEHLHEEH
ncbi:hypothetical protein AOX55_00006736 (plasmid) [Sinorhizobium fredii CCBAU 25509]|nr:hypothetical protein AOX55_00006736 [Sinorhizobium fredii CCBAU 25509]